MIRYCGFILGFFKQTVTKVFKVIMQMLFICETAKKLRRIPEEKVFVTENYPTSDNINNCQSSSTWPTENQESCYNQSAETFSHIRGKFIDKSWKPFPLVWVGYQQVRGRVMVWPAIIDDGCIRPFRIENGETIHRVIMHF